MIPVVPHVFFSFSVLEAGTLRPPDTFLAATGAVCVVYIVDLILRSFGLQVPLLHDSGAPGIVVSVAIVVIAAMNFTVDFQNIADGEEQGLPRDYEWYLAWGTLVTLVWLYLEILRLLAKIKSSSK